MTLSLHSKPVRALANASASGLEELFGNAIKSGLPCAVTLTQLNENYRTNPPARQAMNLAGFGPSGTREATSSNRKLPNEPSSAAPKDLTLMSTPTGLN